MSRHMNTHRHFYADRSIGEVGIWFILHLFFQVRPPNVMTSGSIISLNARRKPRFSSTFLLLRSYQGNLEQVLVCVPE